MGIRDGKSLYSTKFINAEIDDAGGERHVVPIKYVYDDYFFTKIKGQLYCFEIVKSEIKTRRGVGFRTIDYLNYDTTHFRPVSTKTKALEIALEENFGEDMKVGKQMFKMFKILGNREKKDFDKHDLNTLITELNEDEAIDPEKFGDIITFVKDLNTREIVTPLRSIANFLESDLKTTRPAFMGSIASRLISMDGVHQLVTNAPKTAKHDWMKIMLLVMAVAIVGFIAYFGYTQGWFDSITSIGDSFSDFSFDISGVPPGQKAGSSGFLAKYPTPEAAKAAIDRGEISLSDVPANMRDLVRNVKTPSISP